MFFEIPQISSCLSFVARFRDEKGTEAVVRECIIYLPVRLVTQTLTPALPSSAGEPVAAGREAQPLALNFILLDKVRL